MKKLLFFILIFISITISLAETTKLDSLESILKESSGKQKVDILNEIIITYYNKPYHKLLIEDFHWNKVIDYSKKAIEFSEKLK